MSSIVDISEDFDKNPPTARLISAENTSMSSFVTSFSSKGKKYVAEAGKVAGTGSNLTFHEMKPPTAAVSATSTSTSNSSQEFQLPTFEKICQKKEMAGHYQIQRLPYAISPSGTQICGATKPASATAPRKFRFFNLSLSQVSLQQKQKHQHQEEKEEEEQEENGAFPQDGEDIEISLDECPAFKGDNFFHGLAYSTDGRFVFASGRCRTILVLSVEFRTCLRQLCFGNSTSADVISTLSCSKNFLFCGSSINTQRAMIYSVPEITKEKTQASSESASDNVDPLQVFIGDTSYNVKEETEADKEDHGEEDLAAARFFKIKGDILSSAVKEESSSGVVDTDAEFLAGTRKGWLFKFARTSQQKYREEREKKGEGEEGEKKYYRIVQAVSLVGKVNSFDSTYNCQYSGDMILSSCSSIIVILKAKTFELLHRFRCKEPGYEAAPGFDSNPSRIVYSLSQSCCKSYIIAGTEESTCKYVLGGDNKGSRSLVLCYVSPTLNQRIKNRIHRVFLIAEKGKEGGKLKEALSGIYNLKVLTCLFVA